MIRTPSLILLLCMACQSDESPQAADIEMIAARAMLAAVEGRADAFVSDLDPRTFPLGQGKDLTFEKLIRLRTVDGRFLGDFSLKKDGRHLEFSVWFETVGAEWKVSGWDPIIRPIPDKKPTSKHSIDLPATLAAPGLRGAPSPRWAHSVLSLSARSANAESSNWAKVDASILRSEGCARTRLQTQLRKSRDGLDTCVHRFVNKTKKGSRILLGLSTTGQGRPNLDLLESTLPNDPLVQCIRKSLTDQLGLHKTGCTSVIRLMIRPQK